MPAGAAIQLSSTKSVVREKTGKTEHQIRQEKFLTVGENGKLKNFFRPSYRKIHNFAEETVPFVFQERVNFSKEIRAEISKYGDYMKDVFLRIRVPALTATSGTYAGWTQSFGHALIEWAEIRAGGNPLDRIYGMYMDIYDELQVNDEHRPTQNFMIGRYESLTQLETNATVEREFYVRIPFFFSRAIENAFPLLLVQRSKIEIVLKLRPFSELIVYDGATPPAEVSIIEADLQVGMYYLDENLRKEIVEDIKIHGNETAILIEQVQYRDVQTLPAGQTSIKAALTFNNPLKEIIFVMVEQVSEENNDWFNYARRSTGDAQVDKIRLLLDNDDRYRTQLPESYFRLITTLQHHTRSTNRYIYSLPLSENPEDYQPSGVMNASRFDNMDLLLKLRSGSNASSIYAFAINYQLLVIFEGQVGLGWSD